MEVPKGYRAYRKEKLKELKERRKFEQETEWKTRIYIA